MRESGVPKELLPAIAKHVEWTDEQMVASRVAWCRKRVRRAQELEEHEKEQPKTRHPEMHGKAYQREKIFIDGSNIARHRF